MNTMELNKILSETENVNISNYKEIYNKYKNIFENNKTAFITYIEKLKKLMDELNNNKEYKLSVEVGLFLLNILDSNQNLNNGEVIWKFKAKSSIKALTIYNDMLFVHCWRCLYVINPNNGVIIWKFKAESDITALIINNNVLFVGCEYNNDLKYAPLYALSYKTMPYYELVVNSPNYITNHIESLISQKLPFSNTEKSKDYLNLAKRELNKKNIQKAYEYLMLAIFNVSN